MLKVTAYSEHFLQANDLLVTVGTNCPMGGDAGHGGRTVFRLEDLASTEMFVRVNRGERTQARQIEIQLHGDSECVTFIDALEFALKTLREQIKDPYERVD